MNFEEMLKEHQTNMDKAINIIAEDLEKRATNHDVDKLDNKLINDTYNEHFITLKSIPFGTDEYKQYQLDYMQEAQKIHAQQNRHHFYDHRNEMNDINLMDYLEAIIDIYISQKQYEGYDSEKFLDSLKRRGILDMDMRSLVKNTVDVIERQCDKENN